MAVRPTLNGEIASLVRFTRTDPETVMELLCIMTGHCLSKRLDMHPQQSLHLPSSMISLMPLSSEPVSPLGQNTAYTNGQVL